MDRVQERRRYTIDGLDATVEAWDTGKRWNGWHVPAFDWDGVEALRDAVQEAHGGAVRIRWRQLPYRERVGVVVLGPSTDEKGHTYPAATYRLPDGREKTLYAVGAFGWCWYPVEEDDGGGLDRATLRDRLRDATGTAIASVERDGPGGATAFIFAEATDAEPVYDILRDLYDAGAISDYWCNVASPTLVRNVLVRADW